MIETSGELKELFTALAKAQAEMKPAPKNSLNPAFARGQSKGSKYADLADCMETIRAAITKHGLCLSQMYGGPEVFTLLGHESGQWIRSRIAIPHFEDLTPQQIGSATTYLRRYSLGIVGLVTDEDDDGNAATEGHKSLKTDPRGEPHERNDFDPAERDKYVSRFMDAMTMDKDEETKASAVFAVHTEVAHKHDLYIAIADALAAQHGTKFKNAIRKYVDMHKKVKVAA
jgi:hypothetical protein